MLCGQSPCRTGGGSFPAHGQRFATAVTLQPQLPVSPDTLDRLSVTGWRGGLGALVAGLVLSFLLFGYFVI